ncbi:hypothetical protein WJX73_001277 [Symbiochloris irregularis]|uniref:Uncharacterized protein n=1 Tax=Symbiochloris irregularis TaxID=706552 RepID=A0AAW1PEU8_9CHLO
MAYIQPTEHKLKVPVTPDLGALERKRQRHRSLARMLHSDPYKALLSRGKDSPGQQQISAAHSTPQLLSQPNMQPLQELPLIHLDNDAETSEEVMLSVCTLHQQVEQLLADQRAAEERDEDAVALLLEIVAHAEELKDQSQSLGASSSTLLPSRRSHSGPGKRSRQLPSLQRPRTAGAGGKPSPDSSRLLQAKQQLRAAVRAPLDSLDTARFQANTIPRSTSTPRSPSWKQDQLPWMEADILCRQAVARAHAEQTLAAAKGPALH